MFAGLIALAIPLGAAGMAAAATLSANPLKTASVNGRVRNVVYSGTTLYLVGEFTQATDNGSTVSRNHAAAIDTATGHLLPWNPNANGIVYGIAVDPVAGVVYLGGAFTAVGGVQESRLAQVSAAGTGAVVTAWKHPANQAVFSLSINNSRLYVAGRFTTLNSVARAEAGALSLSSGALDPTWRPDVQGGTVYAMIAATDRVYLAGNATSIDGSSSAAKLAAVDPTTGALDPTFNVRVPYVVYNLAVTSTTVYVAAGGGGGHLWSVAHNGRANWMVTADGDLQAVTVIGGLVIGGGHFDNVCNSPIVGTRGSCIGTESERKKLFAVDSGGVLQSWAPQGDSALGVYTAAANAAGNQIAVGGDFTAFHFKAVKQPHVAVFSFS